MRFLDTSRIRVRLAQRVPAADGTSLSVDLYLPPQPGRYPVLLTRTAADNNRMNRAVGSVVVLSSPADRWKALAAQGFIVAVGDVRGRGDSDGKFYPFTNEGADGVATVSWLRGLQECNGKLGVFGSGYGAFCAWAAIAIGAPVDAIASISPFGAVGHGLCHREGAVRLDWLFWMHLIGGHTLQPADTPPWQKIHRHLPLLTMNEALGRSDIQWQQWLEHLDPSDPYWAPLALADRLAKQPTPGLHITGWWDGQLGGARYYYEAAQRSGAPQSLIVGPWDTAAVRHSSSLVGGTDFGPRSVIDLDETLVQFFGAKLRGEHSSWVSRDSRIFITGRNEWIEHQGWPEKTDAVRELHLTSGGSANTWRGDGVLTDSAGPAAIDEVTHNAQMPVDFQAGFRSFTAGIFKLNLEQAHATARDEALVYTSPPCADTLSVRGRPVVTLTVRTEAPDADLYILLSDTFPMNARDLHLSHTAVRLASRKEFQPGKLLTLTLRLDEVAHDFLPGHSVRLTITPSLFPLYARNTHQANYVGGTAPTVASIALHHGAAYRSLLQLPAER